MSLDQLGAGGFAALFSPTNAPTRLGGGFGFHGLFVDGVRLAVRGMRFFTRVGLGWETAWERGFGCCLCHPEWQGGKRDWHVSRISFCLGTQNATWKPAGAWRGVTGKHHGQSPWVPRTRSRPVSGAGSPLQWHPGSLSFSDHAVGQHGMSWLLSAHPAWTD